MDHEVEIIYGVDFRKNYQINILDDNKISVIYESGEVLAGELVPYDDLPYEEFILYVGQQPDYKNIRRLMQAHQLMLQTKPDLGLVLVGRMNPDTIANKQWSEKKGYKNILFTGFLPDEQRDWLFTKTKAYVFPSLMEGFGLPPLEAMAYGTPVVSSNASCMPEILGEAAEYFDPYNVEDIASKTLEVITNQPKRRLLIKRGHKQVKKYSWQRMAEETHVVYVNVLRQNNK